MEQLPFIEKPEIFNIPLNLSTEIEEIDLTWKESDTICLFYSPEIKKRKSKIIKTDRKKSKKSEIHYYPQYAEPSLISY